MTRNRAARALLALALPALLVPALAGPAAAGDRVTEKSIPSVAQVAKVYRHLADGEREVERTKRFEAPGRGCDDSKYYRASGLDAIYYPTSLEDMDFSAAKPTVMVETHRLRSAKQAKAAVKAFDRFLAKCRKTVEKDVTSTVRRLRAGKLGDQRVAMTMRIDSNEQEVGARYVVVRTKRQLTTVWTISMTGVPSAKKALRLAKVAVKQAR